MKRIVCISIVYLLVIATAFGQQKDSRLEVEPQKPVAGCVINLAYNPKGGPLEGKHDIVGIVYTYDCYKWTIGDVVLKREGDIWKGTYTLPENCGFVAFKFQSTLTIKPDTTDNNDDQGFFYSVRKHAGNFMPGTHLAWGITRMPSLGFGIPSYFNGSYKEISDEAIYFRLQKETSNYGAYGKHYIGVLRAIMKRIQGEHYLDNVKRFIEAVQGQPQVSEDEYILISDVYRKDLKDKIKADSIDRLILNRFPFGKTACRVQGLAINSLQGEERANAFDKFRKDFPVTEWYKNPYPQGFVYRNLYSCMGADYYKNGEYEKLAEVLPEMNMVMLCNLFHKTAEYSIRKLPTPAKTYVDITKKFIDQMLLKVNDNSYSYMQDNKYTPMQAGIFARLNLRYNIAVYAQIAGKAGRYKDVVNVMELLDEKERYRSYPHGNEAYIESLEKLGQKKRAASAMIECAKASKMTPHIYKKLEAYYGSLRKKPATTFEEWLTSLKSEEEVEKITETLRAKMVNEPYEPFVLESHNGGIVNSKDFGNDIVVIDFWALWCGPCIAALDGMQMAVNHYKEDSNVKFYFIMTQDLPKKDKINALWKRSNFENMEVLYDVDQTGKKNSRNAVYKSMFAGTSGIPQKAILKNGRIRYRSEGYAGSPSALMDEIIYVVEMLRNEK